MFLCRYDYLKITNDTNVSSGKHCGKKTGKKVEVTGDYAFITFHSDYLDERKGFRILFHIKDSGSNSTTIGIVLNQLYISEDYAVITFQSDSYEERKGFLILFCIKHSRSNSTIGIVLNQLYIFEDYAVI